jgi:DNA-binding transcriptional regulator YbjK
MGARSDQRRRPAAPAHARKVRRRTSEGVAVSHRALAQQTILPLAASKLWRNDPVRRNIGSEEIARHVVALLVQGIGPGKAD